jgi:D-alanine-D-alanine ligase
MNRSKHVCVLMGGWSGAREKSLRSGRACGEVLQQQGFRVTRIDIGRDIANVLQALKPDAALNLVHGRPGDDGTLQGVLELIGIPYSHSGVMASALATQKGIAKRLLQAAGVPVIEEPAALPANGHRLSCVVMGDRALDVAEIAPDADAADPPRADPPQVPARLLPNVYQRVRRLALAAHCALGCRGVSRTDFRWDGRSEEGTGGLICLEVNTQPGMTETSLVPEIAAHAGVSFGELVRWMVEDASLGR